MGINIKFIKSVIRSDMWLMTWQVDDAAAMWIITWQFCHFILSIKALVENVVYFLVSLMLIVFLVHRLLVTF